MNPMKAVRLEKITLNMGAGDSSPRLDASKKVLELLSGKDVVVTKTTRRTTFGGAKGRAIGTKVVLRGQAAEELLKKLMAAVDNRLQPRQFDKSGNFSFGISEYIHITGMNYDPDIGILGLDVAVTLERPGYRVKRKRLRSTVGKKHVITTADAMEWAKAFGFIVAEKTEED